MKADVALIHRALVVVIIAIGLRDGFSYKKTTKNETGKTVFVFERSVAEPIMEAWKTGKPIMVDAHLMIKAEEIFNSAIYSD